MVPAPLELVLRWKQQAADRELAAMNRTPSSSSCGRVRSSSTNGTKLRYTGDQLMDVIPQAPLPIPPIPACGINVVPATTLPQLRGVVRKRLPFNWANVVIDKKL